MHILTPPHTTQRNATQRTTYQLDLDLMVARGAAIYGAGKGKLEEFLYEGDEKAVLNVSAADVLPGRVMLADRGEDGHLRYTMVI
jgi:hypothetical protein